MSELSEFHRYLCGEGQYGTPYKGTAYHKRSRGFEDLAMTMEAYRSMVMHPDEKDDYDWFSPMILKSGAYRRTENDVEKLAPFFAFDIDQPGWSLDRLRAALEPMAWFAYTTASSTAAMPRWRVTVAMSRVYTVEEHPSVFRCFNDFVDGAIDQQTKNVNRISYCPATWQGADNQWEFVQGVPMDVDMLMEMYPVIVPQVVQPTTHLNSVPNDMTIIQDWMVEKEVGRPQGGRMFRIMVRAAAFYKKNGWVLTPQRLASAALAVNPRISPNDKRITIVQEAANAIHYAAVQVTTEPALPINIFSKRTP